MAAINQELHGVNWLHRKRIGPCPGTTPPVGPTGPASTKAERQTQNISTWAIRTLCMMKNNYTLLSPAILVIEAAWPS
jgi:hypothetical protein